MTSLSPVSLTAAQFQFGGVSLLQKQARFLPWPSTKASGEKREQSMNKKVSYNDLQLAICVCEFFCFRVCQILCILTKLSNFIGLLSELLLKNQLACFVSECKNLLQRIEQSVVRFLKLADLIAEVSLILLSVLFLTLPHHNGTLNRLIEQRQAS